MSSKNQSCSKAEGDLVLPANGGFVLQLEAQADIASGHISGRVEHIVSGNTAKFYSLEDLLSFVERNLNRDEANG